MDYPVGPFLRLRGRGEPPLYVQEEEVDEEQQSDEPEEEDEQ